MHELKLSLNNVSKIILYSIIYTYSILYQVILNQVLTIGFMITVAKTVDMRNVYYRNVHHS